MTKSQQLKAYRKNLGLSQSKLAAKYDMSVQNIHKWEQGVVNDSLSLNLFLKLLEKELPK